MHMPKGSYGGTGFSCAGPVHVFMPGVADDSAAFVPAKPPAAVHVAGPTEKVAGATRDHLSLLTLRGRAPDTVFSNPHRAHARCLGPGVNCSRVVAVTDILLGANA